MIAPQTKRSLGLQGRPVKPVITIVIDHNNEGANMSESVIEKVDNEGIVRLTINRPKALNALNSDVLSALEIT